MSGRGTESRRFLATVLFADIVGSTDLAAQIGDDSWRKLLAAYYAALRAQLRKFDGKEIDTAGDGLFASFDQPARAVRAADAMVNEAAALGLALRAAVHTGEVERIGPKVGGIAVVIASRIMGNAGGGEVLVSSTVHDLVAGSNLEFSDRGSHTLKGVPGEWHLFSLDRADAVPVAVLDKAALAAAIDRPRRRRRLIAVAAISLIAVIVLGTAGVYAVVGHGGGPSIPAGPNTLVGLDSAGKVVDVRPVPVGPTALASDAQSIWVASLDAGVLQSVPINASGSGQTIGRVSQPTGIAIGGKQVWAADQPDQTLSLIDPKSGATNATIHTPVAAVAFGADSAWDVDDITDSVHRLDGQTGDPIATIALDAGAFPNAIAVTDDAAWVTNSGKTTVTRIDPSTNAVVVAAIPLRFVPDSISAGGQDVWIGSRASDAVLRLDPSSNTIAATLSVCDQPRAVAADGTGVWIACVGPGEVWHLDHDGKQLSTTPVNGEPTDVIVDNGRIWVTVRQP
jgi:class 3 adenylate cyclase/streptogramin lyase